jgi:hypothetical protein
LQITGAGAISTTGNITAGSITAGLFTEYKKIFCHVESITTEFTINSSQTPFTSYRSATNFIDTTPTSSQSLGYGFNTTGTYNGMFRAPYNGFYRMSFTARFPDGTSNAAIGIIPKTFNGATYTNIITASDGTLWSWRDNSPPTRNGIHVNMCVKLTQGLAILCTPFQSTTFSFALCDFEYITGY